MRHVVIDSSWGWDGVSHAFTCEINLGEHLRARATLKVPRGLEPVAGATTTRGGRSNHLLYSGQDVGVAERIKKEKDQEFWVRDIERWQGLPDGKFGLADGEIIAVENPSTDILLFVGHYTIRGDAVVEETTTAEVIRKAYAGRHDRKLELAVLLKEGQQLVVYVSGRGPVTGCITYTNVGGQIEKKIEKD